MGFSPPNQRPDGERQNKLYTDYQKANYGGDSDLYQRHGCLTLWLAAMLIAACGALAFLTDFDPGQAPAAVNILITCASCILLVQIVSLIGIFNWQKWGVYTLGLSLIASPIFRLLTGGLSPQSIISVFFGFFMIYVFIRPHWKHYKGRDWIGFDL